MFYDWMIQKYLGKDSPRGDLADDMVRTEDFPSSNTRDAILMYLRRKNACTGCIATFKRAWNAYTKEVG